MINRIMNFCGVKSKSDLKRLKDTTKEISTSITSNLPANIQENRKNLFELIVKYNNKEITKEAIIGNLRAGFILLNCATQDEQEQIMKCLLDVELDVKKDDVITNDDYDIYHEIISFIHNKRQEEVKKLLKKVAQKINKQQISISKETIDFIVSLTDSKLAEIKEIFRYVIGNGILKYKNISEDFRSKNFNQSGSDNIKYLGRIFYNQDAVGGKAYIQKIEAFKICDVLIWKHQILKIKIHGSVATEETLERYLVNEDNKKSFLEFLERPSIKKESVLGEERVKMSITKQPTSVGNIDINIPCFVILTDVGVELYSLLKDEVKDHPDEYLSSVLDNDEYKKFGLVFERC